MAFGRLHPNLFSRLHIRTALVTAGEFVGTVWDVACYQGWDGWWVPARRAPGILGRKHHKPLPDLTSPPTFLQWYEAWVERVEVDVADFKAPSLFERLRKKFLG